MIQITQKTRNAIIQSNSRKIEIVPHMCLILSTFGTTKYNHAGEISPAKGGHDILLVAGLFSSLLEWACAPQQQIGSDQGARGDRSGSVCFFRFVSRPAVCTATRIMISSETSSEVELGKIKASQAVKAKVPASSVVHQELQSAQYHKSQSDLESSRGCLHYSCAVKAGILKS